MIMGMVFKIGAMIGCTISIVKSVDGIIPTPLDFIHKCDPVTFVLPAYHDYWKLPGKTDGVTTGTGASVGVGSSTTDQRRSVLSEGIYSH